MSKKQKEVPTLTRADVEGILGADLEDRMSVDGVFSLLSARIGAYEMTYDQAKNHLRTMADSYKPSASSGSKARYVHDILVESTPQTGTHNAERVNHILSTGFAGMAGSKEISDLADLAIELECTPRGAEEFVREARTEFQQLSTGTAIAYLLNGNLITNFGGYLSACMNGGKVKVADKGMGKYLERGQTLFDASMVRELNAPNALLR